MKRLILVAILFVVEASAYCAGWSITERSIVKKIPKIYQEHKSGPVPNFSDAEAMEAVSFGVASKEQPDPLDYAYLIKESVSNWRTDVIYIAVDTPLYLLALNARDQAREYRTVPADMIDYLRTLNAVQIRINHQFMSKQFRAMPMQRSVIVLRDGVRVEPLKNIPAYKGENLFPSGSLSAIYSAADANIQKAAMDSIRRSAKMMSDDQKRMMIPQLRAMGMKASDIHSILGVDIEVEDSPESHSSTIHLSDNDAIFSLEEISKPGKYEIVFREPKATVLGGIETKEVRIAVAFDKLR